MVTFEEFEMSFKRNPYSNLKLIKNVTSELLNESSDYVYHYRLNFDPLIFKQYLFDFIKSENSFLSHKGAEHSVFGLNVYTYLINKYSDEEESKVVKEDMRIFRILWEHKVIMIKRLRYLNKIGYLRDDECTNLLLKYTDLRDEFEISKNIVLRNMIAKDENSRKKVVNRLLKVIHSERIASEQLLGHFD